MTKHNFSVSFADSYKKYSLPLIPIQVANSDGLWFEFLINTTTKYNWIDPEFIKFFTLSSPYLELLITADELQDFLPNHFKDVYEKLDSHRIIGKDGKKQVFEKVRFNFNFEDRGYSEIFSVDNTLDLFNKNKKAQVVAILGGDFLRKNKWIIDYDKLLIYSKSFM